MRNLDEEVKKITNTMIPSVYMMVVHGHPNTVLCPACLVSGNDNLSEVGTFIYVDIIQPNSYLRIRVTKGPAPDTEQIQGRAGISVPVRWIPEAALTAIAL